MKKVFISYRREDGAAMAGRLYDSISARFGQENVFFDVETMAGGVEFRKEIEACLAESGVLLAVMGPRWSTILQERAADARHDDYVAIEIKEAHQHGVSIVPVLAGKQAVAEFGRLGESTSPLCQLLAPLQAIEVDEGKDYRTHVGRLIGDVEKLLGISRKRKLRRLLAGALLLLATGAGYLGAQAAFRYRYGDLPEGARSVGLRAVEGRTDPDHGLPPEVVFRRATHEVFMSGVSGYRTFDTHRAVIDEVVAGGKDFFVLLMDPDAPDVADFSTRLHKPVDAEIRQVVSIIKGNQTLRSPHFHLRFMSRFPPFTAVLTDGHIAQPGIPSGRGSTLRVQSLIVHTVQHQGIILEFGRTPPGALDGLAFYVEDLRKQWQDAAASDEKVAAMLRDGP